MTTGAMTLAWVAGFGRVDGVWLVRTNGIITHRARLPNLLGANYSYTPLILPQPSLFDW